MKVAIPTNDGIRIISDPCKVKGIKIFEIENSSIRKEQFIQINEYDFFPENNPLNNHINNSEKSIKPLIQAMEDCEIVISNGVCKLLFEELVKAEKEVYITETNNVRPAILSFIRRKQNLEKDLFPIG